MVMLQDPVSVSEQILWVCVLCYVCVFNWSSEDIESTSSFSSQRQTFKGHVGVQGSGEMYVYVCVFQCGTGSVRMST